MRAQRNRPCFYHPYRQPSRLPSASGQDQDRYDAQAAGVNDFLTKPTSSRDIIATVNRLIG